MKYKLVRNSHKLFTRLENMGLVKIGIFDPIIGLRFVSTHSLYIHKSKYANSENTLGGYCNTLGGYYSPKFRAHDSFTLADSYALKGFVTDGQFMHILHTLQDITISNMFSVCEY